VHKVQSSTFTHLKRLDASDSSAAIANDGQHAQLGEKHKNAYSPMPMDFLLLIGAANKKGTNQAIKANFCAYSCHCPSIPNISPDAVEPSFQ
jgi:hypothetical protein